MTSRMLVPVVSVQMPRESPLVSEGLRAFRAWEAPSSTRVAGVLLVVGITLEAIRVRCVLCMWFTMSCY
jgi:hypothetical protein